MPRMLNFSHISQRPGRSGVIILESRGNFPAPRLSFSIMGARPRRFGPKVAYFMRQKVQSGQSSDPRRRTHASVSIYQEVADAHPQSRSRRIPGPCPGRRRRLFPRSRQEPRRPWTPAETASADVLRHSARRLPRPEGRSRPSPGQSLQGRHRRPGHDPEVPRRGLHRKADRHEGRGRRGRQEPLRRRGPPRPRRRPPRRARRPRVPPQPGEARGPAPALPLGALPREAVLRGRGAAAPRPSSTSWPRPNPITTASPRASRAASPPRPTSRRPRPPSSWP